MVAMKILISIGPPLKSSLLGRYLGRPPDRAERSLHGGANCGIVKADRQTQEIEDSIEESAD